MVAIQIAKFIVLTVITFFFMQILTNKNKKISVAGTIIICCSSYIAFNGVIDTIIYGQMILIAIDKFMVLEKKYIKAITTGLAGASLILWLTFSKGNSFSISLFYIYLALGIWVIIKNIKKHNITRKDIILCFFSMFVGGLVAYYFTCINTFMYAPETSLETLGTIHLFSYGYSPLLPFANVENKEIYSGILSLFPVSLIFAMIYVYKEEKHIEFFMPMIIAIMLETVWCLTSTKLLGFIGFTESVRVDICAFAIGLGCVYLYIFMIANINENIFSTKVAIRLVLLMLIFYFMVPRLDIFNIYLETALVTLLYYLFINLGDERYKKVLLVILEFWSLFGFVCELIVKNLFFL